jgi:hypothetical protein
MAFAMLNSEIPGIGSGKTPFYSRSLSDSYVHFFHLAHRGGGQMLFASAEDFLPDGTIRGHWVPRGRDWVPVTEAAALDLIFDKLGGNDPLFTSVIERAIELQIPVFGHYGLNRFVGDKWACYQAFSEHLALTRLMDGDRQSIEEQIDAFFELMDRHYAQHDEVAVLKPRWGWESRGLFLLARRPGGVTAHLLSGDQLTQPAHLEQLLDSVARHPYVIQAWVNTTRGIPEIGLQAERHDARFVFVISEPGTASFLQAYVKTPQEMLYFPIERFPAQAIALLEAVAERVAQSFPYGIFCIDLMRDVSGRWFVTELNDQVGFNIDFDSERDVHGVTELMERYLHEIHTMRANRRLPRYRSAR